MRIVTPFGEAPFEMLTFPDGQPHLTLQMRETRGDYLTATIEARIADSRELLDVLLAKDALASSGYRVALDIRYLLGARMDRRIDYSQPFTLQIVANILMAAGFTKIRVLDPHSERSLALLGASPVYPIQTVKTVIQAVNPDVVIAPDKGATDRVARLVGERALIVQGLKHRDPQTGALSGFAVENGSAVAGKTCLILDDLCDGGGTFDGLAAVLLDRHHAKAVHLYVTHGIFSKGSLKRIDDIYTTDSYRSDVTFATVIPVRMAGVEAV